MKPDGAHYNRQGLNAMGTALGQYVANDLGYAPHLPAPVALACPGRTAE